MQGETTDDDPTHRDLARLGHELGERTDATVWKRALMALASPPREFGDDVHLETVAGQVYDAAGDDVDPDRAAEYIEMFLDVYRLDALNDVNDLLGRQSFAQDNYEGQLAFVGEGS